MPKCGNCGTQVDLEAPYCPRCARPQPGIRDQLGAVFLVLIALAFIVYLAPAIICIWPFAKNFGDAFGIALNSWLAWIGSTFFWAVVTIIVAFIVITKRGNDSGKPTPVAKAAPSKKIEIVTQPSPITTRRSGPSYPNIEAIVLEFSSRIGSSDERLYASPNIPAKKLGKALGKYARIGHDERPLFLYDDTILGSGGHGYLLTDRCLYIHNISQPTVVMKLDSIHSVSEEDKQPRINGQLFDIIHLGNRRLARELLLALGRVGVVASTSVSEPTQLQQEQTASPRLTTDTVSTSPSNNGVPVHEAINVAASPEPYELVDEVKTEEVSQ